MPNRNGRSNEHEIATAVCKYLATTPSGTATLAEIKQHLPDFHNLTDADREPSPTRPNEVVWEQQVRNIVSHRDTPGNFINDGLLASDNGSLTLTDAGRYWLDSRA